MSVLVTGAMGHVGYMTALACAEAGLNVVAQYHSTYHKRWAQAAGPRVTWVKGDVADFPHLLEISDRHGVEGAIHAAALPSDTVCRPVPIRAVAVNVLSTQHLLELARQRKWRRVVYVSTGAVYQASDPKEFIRESDPATPGNVYGTTKHMGELLVNMYQGTYGVSACTVRVSWVWGPPLVPVGFDGPRGPIPYFLIRAVRGEKVHEPSGGEFIANFTYVKDVANALLLAYRKESLSSTLYNVSNGQHYSTAEIVETIRRVLPGADVFVGPGMKPWIDYTVLRGSFDLSRIRTELGFEVQYPLEKAIADYAGWLRANLVS
ncbi:MAG TPA: NAD(P)-dependent oxidoreductase [Candidatus Methylomirabilis sp.]|nr:NAD(P)-dependent oxidoreductase [Candidatus Methylomirabilis sp.]